MSCVNLSDKPVKYMMENDILSDFVYGSDRVHDRLNFLYDKLNKLDDPRDFFIVVLKPVNNEIKGIITFDDLDSLYKQLGQNHDLRFGSLYREPFLFDYRQSISSVLDVFEKNDNCNVVLVTDENNGYAGRVKRTNIMKRVNDLRKILDS